MMWSSQMLLYAAAAHGRQKFEKCVELRGLEPLAFWMQTIFFACFYVAGRGLTGRLPAEIVADCRRASPWVWLRWLFVWLFGPSFWLGVRDLWRSGFDTHNISAGSGDRFSVQAAAKKQQVKVPILVVLALASLSTKAF
jgi:hypothetical protein